MLSPKQLKPEWSNQDPYPPLSSFTCLVDEAAVLPVLRAMPAPAAFKLMSAERDNYPTLSDFFNSCVYNCNVAYDNIRRKLPSGGPFKLKLRRDRWWPILNFFPYDREMKDGIDGAASLKPDLVAGNGVPGTKPACYWSMPSDHVDNGMEVLVAVEVKDSWNGIVTQAGTYARAQVSAMPLRLFSLVIGVNHKFHNLRFLIYHRGGLTASHEIDLLTIQGRRDVQRVMFSILLWQTPEDAGLPMFTNGVECRIPSAGTALSIVTDKVLFLSLSVRGRGTLVVRAVPKRQTRPSLIPVRQLGRAGRALNRGKPRPKTEPMTAHDQITQSVSKIQPRQYHDRELQYVSPPNITGPSEVILPSALLHGIVAKYSWPNSGKRQIEAEMYNTCDGQFGVPKHFVSFEACRLDKAAFSNSIFLPPRSDSATSAKYRWYPLVALKLQQHSPPDYRALFVTVTADEGKSLEHCLSAWDLAECLLHALLGWLSIMNLGGRGFLHRDVTIGNVVKLDKPVKRPAFPTRTLELFEPYRHAIADDSEMITQGIANMQLERGGHGALASSEDHFWMKLRGAVAQDEYLEQVVIAAERLEKALAKLGVSTECKALLIDGDMAAELKTYFSSSEHAGAISGTPEFMSRSLRAALEMNDKEYVQNPIDDLNSFVWTALWATVFNRLALESTAPKAQHVQRWRDQLSGEDGGSRADVLAAVSQRVTEVNDYAPLLRGMSPLFRKWSSTIDTLEGDFWIIWNRQKMLPMLPHQKLYVFYRFALEGVADYVELLYEQREWLQSMQ
ncbi:hypothetical protein L227DRAFT_540670 [Lentinus tigrinus ALCF2SS1-6]|uniref:Fungal-type protein kinase domain-containing protein n=2 Tax=Lentinus tigrinus TaxID=5365 RepID=A0A5C2SPH4_9APHY|nr:hypothetical protein L227DRAFT_540670 [Lentinus tigrinus ALCF2SS1-6]